MYYSYRHIETCTFTEYLIIFTKVIIYSTTFLFGIIHLYFMHTIGIIHIWNTTWWWFHIIIRTIKKHLFKILINLLLYLALAWKYKKNTTNCIIYYCCAILFGYQPYRKLKKLKMISAWCKITLCYCLWTFSSTCNWINTSVYALCTPL